MNRDEDGLNLDRGKGVPFEAGHPCPSQIGNYRLIKRIGSGGMGEVYKAVHVGLDRIVALKVLALHRSHQPATLERFRREAKAAAALAHENIVAIHDQGELDGVYYIAFEYVEGENVAQLIHQKGRLSIRQSVEITRQAAKALGHAHAQGIVHRDIKPSNFLIRDDGVVKLADLGLAHRLEDAEIDARVTRDGTTVGTVDYIAPEQARDSKLADARSDIYSLGCTLYHMLTGQPPYPEGTLFDKLHAHASEPIPSASKRNPAVPPSLEAVLRRMMAKRPRDRYQGVQELLADLANIRFDADSGRSRLKGLAEKSAPVPPTGSLREKEPQERSGRYDQGLAEDDNSGALLPTADVSEAGLRLVPQLASTHHDRATSFLMSLVLIVGLSVTWLGAVWLTNRVWADPVPPRIDPIIVGGGDPRGAADDVLGVDAVEKEIDELASLDKEFEEQEVQEILPNVLDVVAQESFDLIDPRDSSQKEDRGKKARKIGHGARGFGQGPGEGGVARENRWEIVYDQRQTLDEYARQLDFFGIELGAVLGRDRLIYLSRMSSRQPVQRLASGGTEDNRLYLLWRGGNRRRADVALFRDAGIDAENTLVMQFLPAEVEQQLARLEIEYAEQRRRTVEEIRRTRFGVRQGSSGADYEFYVIDQAYL